MELNLNLYSTINCVAIDWLSCTFNFKQGSRPEGDRGGEFLLSVAEGGEGPLNPGSSWPDLGPCRCPRPVFDGWPGGEGG